MIPRLWGVITAIGVSLLAVIKVLLSRNKHLKKENKQLEADIEFREGVDEADSEIEQEFSHRADEANRHIDDGEIPDNLRNPNSW